MLFQGGVDDVDVFEVGMDGEEEEGEEEDSKAKEGIYDNASYSSEEGKKSPDGAESDKGSFHETPGERGSPVGEESLPKKPSAPIAQDMGDRDEKSAVSKEGKVNEGMDEEKPETLDPYDVELKMTGAEKPAYVNIAIEDEEETKF